MADRASESSGKAASTSATAAQVVAYLRRHPDFLARHPELLDLQLSPGRHGGDGVVDLQQFMVERLRGEINKLRNEQDEILANSRDNLSTQERIHKAVVELLEAESFEQFIDIITGDLGLLLEVDVVSLCVELSDHTAKRPRHEGIQFLTRGSVDRLLGGKDKHVVLRDESVGEPEIFGPGAELVRSDALLRLTISSHAPAGLIAFGARHPGYFHAGQGTELMSFLGKVIEFGIRTWLDLPKP
ncbi:MAG TPA: DUF484 family protein [Candidatus Cybelea sp.]|nr:DUF484 family protein [Candidatus Cybelea sp.]